MLFRGIFDFTYFARVGLVLAIAFFIMPASASAFDIDAFRQRLAKQRAEREARLENIGSQSTPRPTPTAVLESDEASEPCGCSASVGFAKPNIQWKGNMLEFTPRFDIAIRVRAEEDAPPWHLNLAYGGTAHTTAFSGNQEFGGQCFDSRYTYSGLAGTPVAMNDILRSLFGEDDELETNITMRAQLTGCDTDLESRQTKVTIEELGNLQVRGWRTWRP